MRFSAFEVFGALPELKHPHGLAMLRPWVDVGSVGTLVLSRLEAHFGARQLAKLARPGMFFDFTRYRPVLYLEEGSRQLGIPNVVVSHAEREENDLVFLHLLEPHMLGERYVESVLRLLQALKLERYWLLGSMYDMVPHTRPLMVTGIASGEDLEKQLQRLGVRHSDYQGPTTIAYLISQQGAELGMETATLIVHLPQYARLDENYSGSLRLLEVVSSLYDWDIDLEEMREKAREQTRELTLSTETNPRLKAVLEQLEDYYDRRMEAEEEPRLSPEVERFLREMGKRLGQG